jgi:hypothetical protein
MCAWAAGSYTKGNSGTGGWVGDASLGIGIEAGRHDTQDNDFATGINQCLNKDGSNAATGNLNLGGFKYTNAAASTARTELAQVAQVQDGDYIWLGTTGGTATAQTASAAPAITAYKAGQKFRMKIGSGLGSTGGVATAHTLNVNSLGAKNFVNNEDATNPTLGTWVAGAIMEVVYDGTNFVITNNPGGWLSYTPTVNGTGSMTISSLSVIQALYRKIGRIIHLQYSLNFTTGGTASAGITVSLPVRVTNSGVGVVSMGASYDGVWRPALLSPDGANDWIVHYQEIQSTANWTLGSGKYASAYFTYRSS